MPLWDPQSTQWIYFKQVFKGIFLKEKLFHLNFTAFSPRDSSDKYTLIYVQAWHQTGDKPLFEPVVI